MANESVSLWALNSKAFMSILDEPIKEYLMHRISLQDEEISIQQLVPLKVLGKGMFGTVLLAKHPDKDVFYALKCVSRDKVERFAI